MSYLPTSSFLRSVLAADAVASGATGLLCLAGAGVLGPVLGLPTPLLRSAGFILLPYVGVLAWLLTRAGVSRRAVWALVVTNAVWAIESLILLGSSWVAPTALGHAFVLLQAAVVAGFAVAQAFALRVPSRPEAVQAPV